MKTFLSNIKIGVKIYGLVGFLLLAVITVASTSIFQMSKIGEEIHAVTAQDMPLTKVLTQITTHQLEQAILFERAKGIGGLLSGQTANKAEFVELEHAFAALGHKVEEEMRKGEGKISEAIEAAHTEADRAEFTHLLKVMKTVEKEHKNYETRAEALMARVEHGNFENFATESHALEALGEKIAHEMEAALVEIETFTEQAMLTVEEHEKAALTQSVIISSAALFIGIALGIVIVRGTAGPIVSMTRAMGELANNNMTIDIPAQGRGDEVGEMATAVQVFKDNCLKIKQMVAEQEEAENRTKAERRQMLLELADNFEKNVKEVVSTVTSSATQLEGSAQGMSSNAVQTSSQAATVASASEQASANVQTVATAADELSASISEIGRQVSQSSTISSEAVAEAERVNAQVQGLSEAANKVGEVLGLISDIAEQTNLLALNATIEAARAGDAGKGFAVVANEVKSLANQTAKATEEISVQISSIQEETHEAVSGIKGITGTIGHISEIAGAIAAAVEEQGAATAEIARNVEEAAVGTQQVSDNIVLVNSAANDTGAAAEQILSSAQSLTENSTSLTTDVNKFVEYLRAG